MLIFTTSNQGTITYTSDGYKPTYFTLLPTAGIASERALVDMSVLVTVTQTAPATFGFVVGGSTPLREILVRSIGPSLASFGITNFAPDPVYVLNGDQFPDPGAIGASGLDPQGSGWDATPASAATIAIANGKTGAFSLLPGSNDKADVYILTPGTHTISVTPSSSAEEGVVLIEVYEVE